MTTSKKIAGNTVVLFMSNLLTHFISFLIIVSVARYLGDVGLGKYSFAFSFMLIVFTVGANFGVNTLIIREIAKKKQLVEKYLSNSLSALVLLSLLAAAVGTIIIYFTRSDIEITVVVLLAGITSILDKVNNVFKSVLTAFEMIPYISVIMVVERIVALAVALFVLLSGYGIIMFMLAFVISNLIMAIVYYIVTAKKITIPRLSLELDVWKRLFIKGAPFWFTGMFTILYYRIDNVMLTYMKDYAVAGWYEASYKIHRTLTIFPAVIMTVIFPVMSRLHVKSKKYLRFLYEKSFYYLAIIAFPIAAGVTFTAKPAIEIVYGQPGFLQHSPIALQIIIWGLLFLYFNLLMGHLLNSIGKEKLFTFSVSIAVVFNVVLNLILIPIYSYIGASIATVATEILNFCMLAFWTRRNNYRINYLKVIIKPLIATVVMTIAMFLLYRKMHIIIFIAVCAVIYGISLVLLRGFGKDEKNLIRQFLPPYITVRFFKE
ncbi:oligosaccharide flippase family protein [Candidatus Woesearchaeota archaeon]|nr:oligosaccharide flippase family protein [Candidatus Woesearchaeota archaeon]